MNKLSDTIIAKIKTEAHHPLPRWHFAAKNAAVWTLTIVCITIAGALTGSLIGELMEASWWLAPRWPGGSFGLIRDTITGLWLGGAMLAIVGGVIAFHFTRRGYRYGVAGVTLFGVIVAIVAGVSLIPTRFPAHIHAWREMHLPPTVNAARFHDPDDGRLMGDIVASDLFTESAAVVAIDGHEWEVWFPGVPPRERTTAIFFGEMIDDDIFFALDAQPVPPHFFVQGWPEMPRISE